jgi:hypothetical protein
MKEDIKDLSVVLIIFIVGFLLGVVTCNIMLKM